MSFSATFYTSTANPLDVDKSGKITALNNTPYTVHVKHKIDILRPVFTVDYDAALLAANYVYLSETGRYYFCTVSTDTAQIMQFNAIVDPLYSWASSIINCSATVIRNENTGINYVPDSKLPVDTSRFDVHGEAFPRSLDYVGDSHHYIIVVNKGGS